MLMANSEKLSDTTEYLTLYKGCRVNPCRCSRVTFYFSFLSLLHCVKFWWPLFKDAQVIKKYKQQI
jgi:hypothetical protein